MRQLILLLMLTITSAVYAYNNFIREDRIWEYYRQYGNTLTGKWTCYSWLYKFDGSEEIDGKIYYTLKMISYTAAHGQGRDTTSEVTKEQDDIVARIREEDGKVYELTQIPDFPGEKKDYLIFNFNLKEGETYTGLIAPPNDAGVNIYSDSQKEITCMKIDYNTDLNCNIYTLRINGLERAWDESLCIAYVADGYGNLAWGNITRLTCDQYSGYMGSDYILGGLFKIYDLDGNVIFDAHGWLSSVQNTCDDSIHDGKMYDLNGREIRNPLPGTVYIRDGRKAVAR